VGKFRQCVEKPWKAVDKWLNETGHEGEMNHLVQRADVDDHEFWAEWDGRAVIEELEKKREADRRKGERGGVVKRLGNRLSKT
jgi:hypothetical protein